MVRFVAKCCQFRTVRVPPEQWTWICYLRIHRRCILRRWTKRLFKSVVRTLFKIFYDTLFTGWQNRQVTSVETAASVYCTYFSPTLRTQVYVTSLRLYYDTLYITSLRPFYSTCVSPTLRNQSTSLLRYGIYNHFTSLLRYGTHNQSTSTNVP